MKNIRIAELVGRVIQREPAGRPRGRGHNRAVVCDGLRVVAVEIGNVNFAFAAGLFRLERDFGQRNALFAGDGQHDVVGERVGLPPQRRAGVAAREQRTLAEPVRHPALHIARVAADDDVLRGIGSDKTEALHVKIELQHVQNFAGETVQ